ncbi:MAG: glycosyltransferase family 1 protein [Magnetococcales bacterium]|nr:glycosyltransferase family 1 protein [Magnetococcales bacterium]
MQKLLDLAYRLDATGDMKELETFAAQRYNTVQVFMVLEKLLHGEQVRSAHLLALLLEKSGVRHVSVSFALCVGELIYGRLTAERVQMLRAQTDPQGEKPVVIDKVLVRHALVGLLNRLLPKGDQAAILWSVEILRAAMPEYHTIFDGSAPVETLSLERMRRRRPALQPLLDHPLPPTGAPRPQRRVLLLLGIQGTLIALRFMVAMKSYGWHAEICNRLSASEQTAAEDCRLIAEQCRQNMIDILLLEAPRFCHMGQAHRHYTAMKRQLRENHPDLRVLGISFDSADTMEQVLLEEMGELFDGLLQCHHNPQAPHMLNNPQHKKKIIHDHLLPINDRHFGTTNRPLLPQLFFRGSIRHPHWARLFWLAVADRAGLPIAREINQFLDANDSSRYDPSPQYSRWLLEDYATYIRKYTDATCCLSILTFGNMVRYLTGRSFEVLLSGALLVQEYSPLMHNHFIPGEHYLEFTTIAELTSIMRFINERPEEAEEVRRRGHAFARARYNDERIIGQIDYLLYHQA